MKLLACHIENFGKLSNLSMRFSTGINVINEANAWGKSTLAAFLKVMFYGLDSKKEAKAFEKERVLYRPWQGGVFGGEVDFEVAGKRYRISRSFGRTEKTDEFHLYDLETNLESKDYTENIGLELFDLDSASFKRSIFIAQNDCASDTSDHINAKLGNLADNTDDINNFESATQRLKDILNQLTPDRVTGSLKKRKNYITQLTQELHTCQAAESSLEELRRKEKTVSEQIQELLDIRKNYAEALVVASEASRKQELRLQYNAMCQEVEEKEKKKDAYLEIFPNGAPTEEEFQEQMQLSRQLEVLKTAIGNLEMTESEQEQIATLKEMFDKEKPTDNDIDAALQMFGEIDKQKEEISRQESKLSLLSAKKEVSNEAAFEGGINYKIFLFVGFGIALIGGVLLLSWILKLFPQIESTLLFIPAMVALCCGAILAAIGVGLGVQIKKKQSAWQEQQNALQQENDEKLEKLNQTITTMKEDVRKVYGTIGKFLGNYHIYCEVGEYQSRLYELRNQVHEYERLQEKSAKHQEQASVYETQYSQLETFMMSYGFPQEKEFLVLLSEMANKAIEYQLAVKAYEESYEKKDAFEKRQKMSFWTREAMCPYSLDELNQMIAQADEKLEDLKKAKSQYTKQLEDMQEQLDIRDEKKAELEEQMALQEKDTKRYRVIKLTQEYLTKAKEQFTARYMGPISKGFSKYFAILTGNARTEWVIDANIHLKIRERGELREVKWLSAGYQDLLGVCMRLALVDTMYPEEKPFLILDDPFVNLDKEKVEHGNRLLMTVAEEYQVIYFTCHDSRNPIAGQNIR